MALKERQHKKIPCRIDRGTAHSRISKKKSFEDFVLTCEWQERENWKIPTQRVAEEGKAAGRY